MFNSNKVSSNENPLAPRSELRLINIYLEQGRAASKEEESEVALVLYLQYLETTGSTAKEYSSKVLATTAGQPPHLITDETKLPLMTAESTENQPPPKSPDSVANKPASGKDIDKSVEGDFFAQDRTLPIIEFKLPKPAERLDTTHQLVYCLGLLKAPPSLDDPHQDAALQWVQDDTGQSRRARQAQHPGEGNFRRMMEQFIECTEKSNLLNLPTLEELAKMVQGASKGYLEAHDLVKILQVLNTRMQGTHDQSQDYTYQLMCTVSRVLDAMADCKVEGLDRVTLHGQLSAYIDKFKDNSDPHMVFLAAYTYQALECVPDNESPWQATKNGAQERCCRVSSV
ncbi:hypothetical protein BGZ75_009420 [Mortierella antarctica]|nr:hypothetical protein BGZ75_009420 [Mortierella antarctica]